MVSGLFRSVDTKSTAPLEACCGYRAVGLVPADGGGLLRSPDARSGAPLRFGAEAAVDVGELAAVFDAVVGEGEGFFFSAGLEV